ALERGLTRYARVLRERFGRDVANEPGAGAAGGLGAALLAFLHATFRPGIEVVMETLGFDAAAAGADLLLTGEGRLDEQSLHGKAIAGVIRHAAGRPVVAVCGAVTLAPAQWRAWGLSNAVAVTPAGPPPDGRTAQAALTEGARHLLASGL
ncbi:MAG TPA: glycerate kinase, partial [Myxococcales bacterium]|nr:glycerate kinase [Myxococcales bacterium]